jgi:hypothetical protein
MGRPSILALSPSLVHWFWKSDDSMDQPDLQGVFSPASYKRIKSLCGAKPPQKLRWTNAGRLSAIGAMEISPRTLGARADSGGSAFAPCVV